MNRYLYIQAVVVNALVGSPEAITFRSTEVSAADIDSAYDSGQLWADQTFEFRPMAETVNDYVKQLG